jgi:hypothetical protein
MNIPHNQPSSHMNPLQPLTPLAGGAILPVAPPECRDDAPC